MMLVYFRCDERAVGAEIRLWELQCASANPVMRHCYERVAVETDLPESTIRSRHNAFVAQLNAMMVLVPSITMADLVNPADLGDDERADVA